jgi:hypothetical protein
MRAPERYKADMNRASTYLESTGKNNKVVFPPINAVQLWLLGMPLQQIAHGASRPSIHRRVREARREGWAGDVRVGVQRRAVLLGNFNDLDTFAHSDIVPVRAMVPEKRRHQSDFHAASGVGGCLVEKAEEKWDSRAVRGAEDDAVGDEGVAHAFV